MKIEANNTQILAQMIGPTPPVEQDQLVVLEEESGRFSRLNSVNWGIYATWAIFFIFVVISAGAFILYYLKKLKNEDRDEKAKKGVLMEIRVPRGNEYEISLAEQMFANLYGIDGVKDGWKKWVTVNHAISFEIVGLPGEIRFYVYCPQKYADLVEKQVVGAYQDADIQVVQEYNIFKEGSKVSYTSLVTTDEPYYPIKTHEDFKSDTLSSVLSSISKLQDGEGAIVQFVITPAGKDWQKAGQGFIEKVEKNNADPEKKRIHISQEQSQGISKKTSKVGFRTAIRIVTTSPSQENADSHLNSIVGAFDQLANPGLNDFKKEKIDRLKEREFVEDVIYRKPPMGAIFPFLKKITPKKFFNDSTILNIEELATLYHFPNKDTVIPNIHWLLARELPADTSISSEVNSKDTIWIGNNIFRGVRKEICFQRDDRRRHAYIVGQTGSGKSWLQVRMMIQDIYNGDGLCFIDPHGSTARMLLDRIPHERAEDVIYLNVADFERPLGINLMDFRNEQEKHMIINGMIDLMKKLYDPNNQGIVGPILERAVRNAMLTAMSEEGSTLVEVLRIITDQDWVNKKWLPLIKDDLVKRYWTDQMAKTSDFHKSETLGYITSKFDRFVTNVAVRNIIGQSKSSFDMRDVMDNGKILIINLSKGLIGEFNAQFLGMLIIPKIIAAALSRENIEDENDRRDFFFYVDEFQNFASDDFASILSEARKYRLNLTVANQYIHQLTDKVKEAVFGNVGTLMIARLGPDDAKYLESQFDPHLNANDLMNQPNMHYYVKMISGGSYPSPFSLDPTYGKYFPESGFDIPVNKEVADLIVQLSKVRYGRDVKVVEEQIRKRAELEVDDKKDAGKMGALPPMMNK